MDKERLERRIKYAIEHFEKYDIKGIHNLITAIEARGL